MAQRTLTENINQAIADFDTIKTAIIEKGVPVPDGTPTSAYGDMISEISGEGVDTSNDTVTPDAMREGVTAHNADGQPITGTIPDYDGGNTVELTSPDGATLNTEGTYCEGNIEVVPKLQEKIAIENGIVAPDTGYAGLKSVTVDVFTGADTTNDTVTPEVLLKGFTAHDAAGQPIVGVIPDYNGDISVELTSPNGVTLHTAETYCETDIEVIPKLQNKTTTENGTIVPDDDYAGLK